MEVALESEQSGFSGGKVTSRSLPLLSLEFLWTIDFHIVQSSWIKATNRATIAMMASMDKAMVSFVDVSYSV